MARFEILNNIDHKNLKVRVERSAELGDNLWFATTFPTEFRSVQRHYPIFFVKNQETGEFQAAAMFGVEKGENLFLNDRGWDASYIPLDVMRQPFLIGLQQQRESGSAPAEPLISVDMDNPRVNKDLGEPVFLEHGGHSPYLEQISSILKVLHAGMRHVRPFFQMIEDMDLIESFVLDAQLSDGSEHRLSGFYTVNDEALKELPGEHLERLHNKGFLEAVYMVIASMSNLPLLLDRKNLLRESQSKHAGQ